MPLAEYSVLGHTLDNLGDVSNILFIFSFSAKKTLHSVFLIRHFRPHKHCMFTDEKSQYFVSEFHFRISAVSVFACSFHRIMVQ